MEPSEQAVEAQNRLRQERQNDSSQPLTEATGREIARQLERQASATEALAAAAERLAGHFEADPFRRASEAL